GRGGLETQRDRSGKALNMAAGSASWRGLCKQHSKVPPLKLVPFLPQDNNTADMSSISGQAGSSSSSSSSSGNTISRANAELGRLLDVGFPTFLSFVLEDESLAKFIDTFLRFRRRHYESTAVGQQQQQQPSEEPAPLQELGRRVFLVLLRAVGPEHASLAKEENNADSRNGASRPGELLVADGGILSPPAVLDVCALYGRSNPSLVIGLLRSLGELDGGAAGVSSLAEGVEKAVLAAAGALAEVHAKMAGAQDGLGLGPPIDHTEASDVLSYVTDVAVSVGSLLRASCGVRAVGGGGGGGSGGGSGSGGGIGLLAQRLQGSDGEVSPEGLAAALALTFEATLPALEGVLLAPTSSGKVGAPDSESVRARGRVARQWLLRCLHGLIGPVFLQPLGLQEASPSVAGSGDGDGAGDAGVADGLFSFVTSVTAASGHLAPTGYAGSLLGEYNRRFRLADALDQAQALGTQPIPPQPPLPPSEKQRTPRVGLAPGLVLGPERTEYLTGVLRALPVSEEGVSKEAEAEAAA
ncbi:unnamed protein product, partial [Ectocarpus sp. 12 AP-2014]